jgi:hypothetical protein
MITKKLKKIFALFSESSYNLIIKGKVMAEIFDNTAGEGILHCHKSLYNNV